MVAVFGADSTVLLKLALSWQSGWQLSWQLGWQLGWQLSWQLNCKGLASQEAGLSFDWGDVFRSVATRDG